MEEQKRDHISSLHLPNAGSANPYQQNLTRSLNDSNATSQLVDLDPPYIFSIVRNVRENDGNIVHIHWLHTFYYGENIIETMIKTISFIVELLILKLFGYSIVWTAHNTIPHNSNWETYHKVVRHLFARSFDSIIVHCPAAQEILMNKYRLPKRISSKFHIIPHGNYIENYPNRISREEAKSQLAIEEETVFLFFGQLREYKGVENLLDAFNALDLDARLIIAGKPESVEYGNKLQRYCDGMGDITLVPEFIPDEDLQLYFNAADATVLPYQDILTSGSMISALSFGCPPIVPDIGCNSHLVGEGGIVFDPDTPLSDVLEMAHKHDLEAIRRRSLERAKELDWDNISEQTIQVYIDSVGL